ncbi:four helix bundle protein [Candidatus Kuenenbacteria bacterium]|nr:four helix bundle protein [Candidatus Kuenenbacteria bacterium]
MRKCNKDFSKEFKQRIYNFILELLKFSENYDWKDVVCQVIKKQFIRSGTSIGANYIEAIAGGSDRDFANYLRHCLKSANETQFWLVLLRDMNKGDQQKLKALLCEVIEISRLLGASVKTLQKKNQKKKGI